MASSFAASSGLGYIHQARDRTVNGSELEQPPARSRKVAALLEERAELVAAVACGRPRADAAVLAPGHELAAAQAVALGADQRALAAAAAPMANDRPCCATARRRKTMRILGLVLLAAACSQTPDRPRPPHSYVPRSNHQNGTSLPAATSKLAACRLTKPSPTPELTWMKQPVADWLRGHDAAKVPPYCSGPGSPTSPRDPAFDAWFSSALRTLARLSCEELDARLITFRGASFGTGARVLRRELPPSGSGPNRCYASEGPSLTFGVDDTGAVTCVIPTIDDGPSTICLG